MVLDIKPAESGGHDVHHLENFLDDKPAVYAAHVIAGAMHKVGGVWTRDWSELAWVVKLTVEGCPMANKQS